MFPPPIFESGLFRTTKQAMEANFRSHAEATHNLNNYDTPGFRCRNTDFQAMMNDLAGQTPKGAAFQAYLDDITPSQPVNVEQQLARLAQSSMENDALTRILNKQYSSLRQAIFEGKR